MDKDDSSQIDHLLMKNYLEGDITAFSEIYNRYSGRVYAYLSRKVLHSQDTDELVQAVFMKFHQSRHHFNFQYSVLQWLYVISKTTFIDFYRKDRSNKTVPFDPNRDDVAEVTEPNSAKVSFTVIENLPLEQQQIIRLRLIDEESYNEIATRLNKSEISIRQIFSRAMKKLRNQIQAEQSNE